MTAVRQVQRGWPATEPVAAKNQNAHSQLPLRCAGAVKPSGGAARREARLCQIGSWRPSARIVYPPITQPPLVPSSPGRGGCPRAANREGQRDGASGRQGRRTGRRSALAAQPGSRQRKQRDRGQRDRPQRDRAQRDRRPCGRDSCACPRRPTDATSPRRASPGARQARLPIRSITPPTPPPPPPPAPPRPPPPPPPRPLP